MTDYDTSIFGMGENAMWDDTDIGSPDDMDDFDDQGFIPSAEAVQDEQDAEENELYAGKFKSVEALEQSYQELQSLLGRRTDDAVTKLQDEVEKLRSQLESKDDDDEGEDPWYSELAPEQILAALQTDPGRVLDALVRQAIENDPRIAETKQATEQIVADRQVADAEQMAASWVVENDIPTPIRNEMVNIFNADPSVRESFEPMLMSGSPEKVALAMGAIARMASERVSDTTAGRRAAKRSAQTAPATGTRGSQSGSVNDYAKNVVNDILRSANSSKLPW